MASGLPMDHVPCKFDVVGDASSVSIRWEAWLEEFEAYADSIRGLFNDNDHKTQRRAALLYTAGAEVRKVFKTLSDIGNASDYDRAVTALNKHFKVEHHTTFRRHLFRITTQKEGETIAQFVTRLRNLSTGCSYGEDTDNQIRDQVIETCISDRLRRKLLEKGKLTLAQTLEIAATFEAVESQMKLMSLNESEKKNDESVHKVAHKSHGYRKQYHKSRPSSATSSSSRNYSDKQCERCGQEEHELSKCPAQGRKCYKCHGKNHLAAVCRRSRSYSQNYRSRNDNRPNRESKVRQVNDESNDNCESDYHCTFKVSVKAVERKCVIPETIPISVGGVPIQVVVDSASDANLISEQMWIELKKKKIKCVSRKVSRRLFGYSSDVPLEVIGVFDADVHAGNSNTRAEFVVAKGNEVPLLGKETAYQLGVLKIGLNVNKVASATVADRMKNQYPKVFEGLGKLRDRQVQLAIDPKARPIAQPLRRTPFALRAKVEEKIKELIESDVIEEATEPSEWVSPVVIVPKPNQKDIRMCIDMCRVNQAILRHRHPIPTVEEILQDLTGGKIFSKLDLKYGYHQLELHPDSRQITTFVTHCGLYHYKRLCWN
jgi:hypothetical protein